MPELPEVETVRRHLEPAMVGKRIARLRLLRADLRKPFPRGLAARVKGRRVERLSRRAKYLLLHLEGGTVLLLHLGMSGRLLIDTAAAAEIGEHVHAVFEMDDGNRVSFQDPRRFGLLDMTRADSLAEHPLLRGLGPEPIAKEFTGPVLAAALKGKATSIKAALMDQRVVAGLGNIYVCEALFRAGISPKRKAGTVAGERAVALVAAIKEVLGEALEAGGSTLRDHRLPSGELGYFQHAFLVYDREGRACPGCDCRKGIQRIVQQGRSTFYCAHRQH